MDDNFLKKLQQNSTPREEVLRKQRKLGLEKQRMDKLKAEAYEKDAKEKFRIETDRIYDEFVGVIKELCIEASRNGLYITRNGKNEIHGFIAQTYTKYGDDRNDDTCLKCYIKEFSKNNFFGQPQFKYDIDESLHRSIDILKKALILRYDFNYDKKLHCNVSTPVYNTQEESYFINFIKKNIPNLMFIGEFHNYYIDKHPLHSTKFRSIDFIISY